MNNLINGSDSKQELMIDGDVFFSIINKRKEVEYFKSIEDFENNFLIEDYDSGLYKVNQMSNIYAKYPDFDCEGCNAIKLCDESDINKATGYLINGVASKWDELSEPQKKIEEINVNFSIGKGIPVANLDIKYKSWVFTTDDVSIFKIFAKNRQPIVYVSDNDDGFYIINNNFGEDIFKVMIGSKPPKMNGDLFISSNNLQHLNDELKYNYLIEQVSHLKNIEDARLNMIANASPLEATKQLEKALVVRTLSQIEEKPTDWIWEGWLAARKITVLAGIGGCGKTNLMLSIAATISVGGVFPDGSKCEEPGKVLIYSTEDAADDTLKPRIMSYEANLDNIAVMDGVVDRKGKIRSFGIEDITALENYAKSNPELRLLIIDPVVGLVQGDLNKANTVRQALDPLSKFAEDYNCAVVCITHLSKSAGKENMPLVERFLGSQAFTAKARMALCALKDENEDNFYLSRVKTNTTKQSDSHMRYQIESTIVGKGIETSKTTWLEPFVGSFDTKSGNKKEKVTEINRAKKLILDLLSKNETIASKHLKLLCSEGGISDATYGRAIRDIGAISFKREQAWYWRLPT